jgi:hypothetical protein
MENILVLKGTWPNALAIVFVLIGSLYLLYWAALPKPIPGIPYNQVSAKRLAGDIPEFIKEKDGLRFWMRDQFIVHNSPVVQIFVAPFKRPWVLVSDFRESQDMTMRRTKEFDRSGLTYDSFGALAPTSYICMRTDQPLFRHNRALLKDLMTTSFLHQVSIVLILVPFFLLTTSRFRRLKSTKSHAHSSTCGA